MNIPHLTEYIGGVPFLSETFNHKHLLSLVAAKRYDLSKSNSSNSSNSSKLVEYLSPQLGAKVYSYQEEGLPEIKFTDLNEQETNLINQSIKQIISVVPEWREYFNIPIRYRMWSENRTSCTCAFIPQTIYLGEPAFNTINTLIEALVHEFSHVWMDFITEIVDLQKVTANKLYIIPKTQNAKLLRGVILAAHFAAVVISFYSHGDEKWTEYQKSRIQFLHSYLNDCITLIKKSDEFSLIGYWAWTELKMFCEKMEECCQINLKTMKNM